MKQIKKLNRDIVYKIIIGIYDNCSEYLLVDANDSDEIFAILEEEDIENE